MLTVTSHLRWLPASFDGQDFPFLQIFQRYNQLSWCPALSSLNSPILSPSVPHGSHSHTGSLSPPLETQLSTPSSFRSCSASAFTSSSLQVGWHVPPQVTPTTAPARALDYVSLWGGCGSISISIIKWLLLCHRARDPKALQGLKCGRGPSQVWVSLAGM